MRTILLGQVLKNYEGEDMKTMVADKAVPFTLKRALMVYIRNCNAMGLNDHEQLVAYQVGQIVGPQEDKVNLTTEQYDVVKKLADNGKINQNGKDLSALGVEIQYQVKELIDATPLEK